MMNGTNNNHEEEPGMNPAESYQSLCDDIFGTGRVKIKPQTTSNPVIDALAHPTAYKIFKRNFTERLRRLKKKFQNTASYSDLLEQVKQGAEMS